MLHNNRELFEQAVLKTAEYLKIDAGIVEKDYYVTLILKEISLTVPDLVFKGGTSLSKCHKVINRFSEDIDLTVEYETKPSEGKRRSLKKNIVDTIEKSGLVLANPDEIKSRREFNKYIVDYPSIFTQAGLKNHLQIETMIKIRAYPNQEMNAASLIYDYFVKEGFSELIDEHALAPFTIKVQSAERTFVDKIFALADYYLADNVTEHSRHIYDLYKLLDKVQLDEQLRILFENVRIEREPHQVCLSARESIKMSSLLKEIVDTDAYKEDFNNITSLLIFEKTEYEEAITSLKKIIEFLS